MSTSASIVRDYTDMSTDVIVDITIKFSTNEIEKLQAKETEYGCNALEKLLKLYTTRTTTNMHVFDETEKLRKFDTPEQVVDHYMGVRMQTYVVRKQHQVGILEREAMILSNKARFITEVLNDTLISAVRKDAVNSILTKSGYDMIDDDEDYKYLVRLPMDSVTEENVERIMKEKESKLKELNTLKSTSEQQIWLQEIGELREAYQIYKKLRSTEVIKIKVSKKSKVKKNVAK